MVGQSLLQIKIINSKIGIYVEYKTIIYVFPILLLFVHKLLKACECVCVKGLKFIKTFGTMQSSLIDAMIPVGKGSSGNFDLFVFVYF